MEQRIYQERIQNTDELRQRLLTIWKDLEQHVIDTGPTTTINGSNDPSWNYIPHMVWIIKISIYRYPFLPQN